MTLTEKLARLPDRPGVYIYRDAKAQALYGFVDDFQVHVYEVLRTGELALIGHRWGERPASIPAPGPSTRRRSSPSSGSRRR